MSIDFGRHAPLRPRLLTAAVTSLGVIVTCRNRPDTLAACLNTIRWQTRAPEWVLVADLGSDTGPARATRAATQANGAGYLRLRYTGPWVKGLAFNTALRHAPAASHVAQLDADMLVHPSLLQVAHHAIAKVDGVAFRASYLRDGAVPQERIGTAPWGHLWALSGLDNARLGSRWAIYGCYVLPRAWLLEARGMDEEYVGWGFADSDLWWRAERRLSTWIEGSGSLVIHQPHPRQPGAARRDGNPNWQRFERRRDGAVTAVNPAGWGNAHVEELLHPHKPRALANAPRSPRPLTLREELRHFCIAAAVSRFSAVGGAEVSVWGSAATALRHNGRPRVPHDLDLLVAGGLPAELLERVRRSSGPPPEIDVESVRELHAGGGRLSGSLRVVISVAASEMLDRFHVDLTAGRLCGAGLPIHVLASPPLSQMELPRLRFDAQVPDAAATVAHKLHAMRAPEDVATARPERVQDLVDLLFEAAHGFDGTELALAAARARAYFRAAGTRLPQQLPLGGEAWQRAWGKMMTDGVIAERTLTLHEAIARARAFIEPILDEPRLAPPHRIWSAAAWAWMLPDGETPPTAPSGAR